MTPAIFLIASLLTVLAPIDEPQFDRIVIDNDFPGAYQVEVADVNGDEKPDIIAVGGGTCAWYENPTWKKRIISTPQDTPDIITSATADLDGDGKAEVAIGYDFAMNTPKRGKLLLTVQGKSPDDPWTFVKVADVPSIHRVRWGDWDSDGRPELIVAPIFGPDAKPPAYDNSLAKLTVYHTGRDPKAGEWTGTIVAERPVLHAIEVNRYKSGLEVATADNLGVAEIPPHKLNDKNPSAPKGNALFVIGISSGAEGKAPKRGASEVHFGHRSKGPGFGFVATIEPWHGHEVVIANDRGPREVRFGPRTVIDDTLDDGHALWVADVDGDGDDEVFAGHRGKDHRVSMYKFDGKTWNKTVLDREIAAQDLRGGDLNGDGKPDVVAVGGSTHNVILYRTK